MKRNILGIVLMLIGQVLLFVAMTLLFPGLEDVYRYGVVLCLDLYLLARHYLVRHAEHRDVAVSGSVFTAAR